MEVSATSPRVFAAPPSGPRVARVVNVISIALACGLWTGILHSVVLAITRLVFHQLVWYSREFVWMAPVAYTMLIAPLAVFLAIAVVAVPYRLLHSVAIATCVAFSAFGLLLPYTQISRTASLILSLGIGVACARAATRQPKAWVVLWRWLALSGAAVAAVAAAGIPLAQRVSERRALHPVASADAAPPNVLILILDTVRAASMSLYGAVEQTTPHLERWAREGVAFEWAFSTAPWTLPSHASMFTGRYAGGTSADWKTPLDNTDSTLAEYFQARGYATAGFVGNMQYTSYDSGLDRGFLHYEDYPVSFAQLWNSTSYTQTVLFGSLASAKSLGQVWTALRHPNLYIDMKHGFAPRHASELTSGLLRWQAMHGGQPFLAFVNFMDAHQPYYAPPTFRLDNPTYKHPRYDAAIAYLDNEIDGLLTTLQQRGVLDNTVVVITADHGELFNEHGLSGHAHNVYTNVLHVPLVIRYPGRVPAGARIARAVSLRDLAATVVDLAGAHVESLPGTSLASVWNGGTQPPSTVLAEVSRAPSVSLSYPTAKGPLRALFDDSMHYIQNRAGAEELYRYRQDSREATNVALDQTEQLALVRWRTQLAGMLSARRERQLADRKR